MPPIATSTNQFAKNRFVVDSAITALIPGPYWKSFEEFRTAGNGGLDAIPERGVATLRSKSGTFRVIRDIDFQRLVGLAADIHRFQTGFKIVIQAAKVAVKHPDDEHIRLLIESASLITECPELPQQQGHFPFELTSEELSEGASENFDVTNATVPRPHW